MQRRLPGCEGLTGPNVPREPSNRAMARPPPSLLRTQNPTPPGVNPRRPSTCFNALDSHHSRRAPGIASGADRGAAAGA
jgi:hypothetical protein